MEDGEALVILALNVEPVQSAFIQDTLRENHIECVVTGDYSSYGSRGLVYVSAQGMGRFTIKVKKKDEIAAIQLMEDLGYSVLYEDAEEQNFLRTLASPTEIIPYLGERSLNVRLAVMALVITAIVTAILLVFLKKG